MEFKKVIAGAFYYIYEYRATLVKALAWPFIALCILDATEFFAAEGFVAILLAIVGMFIQTIFAITTHRILLLGRNSVSMWGIFSWSKRETFFVLHIVGLFIMATPVVFLGFIPDIGGVLAGIILCWFAGRFCLVFPGIAIDKGVSFKLSWGLTKNHQFLMFLVVVVFPVLIGIPPILLSSVPYAFLFASLLSTLAIVFEVAALSMAYKLITAELYENA